MAYTPQTWSDGAPGGTPIDAAHLNHIEAGVVDAETRLDTMQTAVNGKAALVHTHPVGDLTATGAASSTTFLRGDGTWATPAAGSGGAVTSVNGKTGVVSLTASDVSAQPSAAELTTIAALTHANDTVLQTKAGAWVASTPAQVKTDLAITKGDVALGNVDNTSDVNKPVSTPQQTALDAKAPLASPAFTGTPTGITKTHVGLGNVDNTSDVSKPISTTQQAALDTKATAAGVLTPADHGLLAWSGDPQYVLGGQALATAGTVYATKVRLPTAQSVSRVCLYSATAGATLTAGQCFAALYRADGTLVAQTADQATAWATSGAYLMTLAGGPYSLVAADYFVAYWFNGTTGPAFARFSSVNAALTNFNVTANDRFFTANTGVTTTAPATLGTKTRSALAYWSALAA